MEFELRAPLFQTPLGLPPIQFGHNVDVAWCMVCLVRVCGCVSSFADGLELDAQSLVKVGRQPCLRHANQESGLE